MKKTLKPFTGTGAVFFPVGTPDEGGTCENATPLCLKYCYAKNPQYPQFDEEILIPESEKQEIYEFIMKEPIGFVVKRFLDELDGLQTDILHWFGTGDCMAVDTERVSQIIDAMPSHVVQMGFTRNGKLWSNYKNIFALTIKNKEEAEGLHGIFSIPDYKQEISVMYSPDYEVNGGLCGPITCRDRLGRSPEHYINCRTCLRLKTGCFDKRFDNGG